MKPNAARHERRSLSRSPRRAIVDLLAIVGVGLGSRAPFFPHFVHLYAGDVLWGVMFYLLFRALWSSGGVRGAWLGAFITSELIEFSQLYRAPWAERIRDTAVGGLLLGHQFLWSDVLCVALGASCAALVGWARPRRLGG